MTDAEPQPPVVAAAEVRLDVAEPVVPRVPATQFHLRLARPQIEFVVHDENGIRRDAEKTCERRQSGDDRFAGSIERRRRRRSSRGPRARHLRRCG